jgi:predicted TIM-barrel fold metal-dependent hydrolase
MVIDAYTHIGRTDSSCVEDVQAINEKDCSVEEIFRNMEVAGVDRTVIIPVQHWEYREANREIARLVEEYPEKLIGFGRVDPNCPECAYDVACEAVKDLGLKGLEVSGFYWVNYDPSIACPLFARLFTLNVPILIRGDTDYGLVQRALPQIVDRFRDKTIIVAMSPWAGQGFYYPPFREPLVDMAKLSRNFYLVISTVVMCRNIEEIVWRVGVEQVMFGSNAPYSHPVYEIARVKALNLTDEERGLILGGNIARILGV